MAKTTIADLQKWSPNQKWSARVKRQGKTLNAGAAARLDAINVILQNSPHYGREKEDITLMQGGYNKGGVSASAGTHDGGAVWDSTAYNWKNRSWVSRILGGTGNRRPAIRGVWADHIHDVTCGDGTASSGAKKQVTAYYNGRNGLANNGKDIDKRPKVLPILFVAPWDSRGKPGKYYLTKSETMRDQPASSGASRGTVAKGSLFTVAAVVNVKGTLWAVNIHGNCVPKSSLTTKKPNPLPEVEPFDAVWRVTKNGKWGYDAPGGNKKYERAAGYKLFTTGRATVNGKPWYVTRHGTWYDAQHLVVWVDQEQPDPGPHPIEDTKTYRVEADGGLWGLAHPGSGNEKKVLRKNGSTLKAKAQITLDNGETWIQGTDGFWSSAEYLSADVSVTMNIGTINVIRWRLGQTNPRKVSTFKKGLDYEDRVPGLVQMRRDMGVSMYSTTESGQYRDADLLSQADGDGWKNFLHGDAGDLTMAIHWHDPKRNRLESGKYATYGSHHNWATWGLFQDRASGVIFLHPATHLHHTKRGNDAPTEGDKIRREQAKVLVSKAQALAKDFEKKYGVNRIPIIFSGDFNQDNDDSFDYVGDVMADAGFADAEVLAQTKSGPDTTYPNIPPHLPSHRRFDRLFVPIGTKVAWMRTIEGPPYTDHNGVSIQVTLSNH